MKPEPRSLTITMPYPGSVISVNHYQGHRRGGGYYVKPEAKAFQEELGWLLKTAHIEDWTMPVSVTCSGKFKDTNNTPDLSNLSKVILDGIEELTGINDQNYRWHDGAIRWKKDEEPELTITVEEGEQ